MEFSSLQFSQALTTAFSCVPFIVVCRICQSIRVVFVNRPSVTLHLCNVGPSGIKPVPHFVGHCQDCAYIIHHFSRLVGTVKMRFSGLSYMKQAYVLYCAF
jgi:hypothetical protein